MFLSFRLSFFLSFCRLFWKLLIFVSVNPTFLQLGVQFCWLCFLCLPCTYSVERWFVVQAFVFCAPILIVVSMGQVFFVVLARFCVGSRVKFLAALVLNQFLFSSQLVIFPRSTNSFYVFRDVSKLMFLGMFQSRSQVIIV